MQPGMRVVTNYSCSVSPQRTEIKKSYVNELGTVVYVMENGQRLGRREFRAESPTVAQRVRAETKELFAD